MLHNFTKKYFTIGQSVVNGITKTTLVPLWDKILEIPEFKKLQECEQNPKWHREGNAFNHTKNVVEFTIKYLDSSFFSNTLEYYEICVIGALFHDIGKSVTTFEKDGVWHSYGHEIEGEKITRRILWDEGYYFREKICALVRYHMDPLNIYNSKMPIEKCVELSNQMISVGSCFNTLLQIKRFDILGSVQENIDGEKNDLEKILNLFKFNTDIADMLNLIKKIKEHNTKPKANVVMLIGLPGSGKDTFIKEKLIQEDSPFTYVTSFEGVLKTTPTYTNENSIVLCRDDIRTELGFCKEGEKIVGTSEQENKVSDVFNQKLLKAAEEGKTIIINNINLKKKYRKDIINRLQKFNVNVTYIYVEAKNLQLNIDRRNGQISENVFNTMIENFDWPEFNEYNEIYFWKNG